MNHFNMPSTRPCFWRAPNQVGFTIMEVVAVLIILGILAAVAISRFGNTQADEVAAANTLKTHLRYAQLRAMGDIQTWGISFDGNSYTLLKDGAQATVNLPGENSPTKALTGVTISPTTTVTFSAARGQPTPANGHTITIGTQTLTITHETGFIP